MENTYLLSYLLMVGVMISWGIGRGYYEHALIKGAAKHTRARYLDGYYDGNKDGLGEVQESFQRTYRDGPDYNLDIREVCTSVAISKRMESDKKIMVEHGKKMLEGDLARAIDHFILDSGLVTIRRDDYQSDNNHEDQSYYVGWLHVGKRIPKESTGD